MATREMTVHDGQPQGLVMSAGSVRGEAAGMLAMAEMPDEEFAYRLASLQKGQARIEAVKRALMKDGAHFGVIPSTDKPTLLKPGAEVLCNVYGLRADFLPTIEHGDGITAPPIAVTVRAELHLGDLNGPVVAVGLGAANSWERKYRYRRGERTCPECGAVGTIRRSGFPNKPGSPHAGEKGWWCRDCRANFADPKDARILEQQVGDVENPDQHDLANTLLKMAKKRAHIDGTLTATGSSALFTQDLEEEVPEAPTAPEAQAPAPAAPRPAAAPHRTQAAPPAQAHQRPQAQGAPAGDRWNGPCPRCGKDGAVIKSRFGEGWICWSNKGGCGHKWTAATAEEPELFDGREPGQEG